MDVFRAFAWIAELSLTIYGWVLIAVILLSWVQPDPSNPIVVFLHRITSPYFRWVGGILPAKLRFFGVYFALLLVWWAKIFIPSTMLTCGLFFTGVIGPASAAVRVGGHFILASIITAKSAASFFILLLIVWFVLTLVHPQVQNPIVRTVYLLVDFIITPLQRRLPRMRVDISPLVAAALIWLVSTFALSPIAYLGSSLGSIHHIRESWLSAPFSPQVPQQPKSAHPLLSPEPSQQQKIY